MPASKNLPRCASCNNLITTKNVGWFARSVRHNGIAAEILFKIEIVESKAKTKLCLRCCGDLIAQAATELHAVLVAAAVTDLLPPL